MTDPQNPSVTVPGYQPQPSYPAASVPGYPQYQQPSYPAAAPAYQPQPPAKRPSMWAAFGPGRNLPGVLSLCAVVASSVIDAMFSFVMPFLVMNDGFAVIQGLSLVRTGIGAILMLTAVGLGIAGLVSSNPSKWPAIAGLAVGAFGLVGMLVGIISNLLYSLF